MKHLIILFLVLILFASCTKSKSIEGKWQVFNPNISDKIVFEIKKIKHNIYSYTSFVNGKEVEKSTEIYRNYRLGQLIYSEKEDKFYLNVSDININRIK